MFDIEGHHVVWKVRHLKTTDNTAPMTCPERAGIKHVMIFKVMGNTRSLIAVGSEMTGQQNSRRSLRRDDEDRLWSGAVDDGFIGIQRR